MKRKHKIFLKANIMSLFFIAVSFISGTLAWFAYTGLSDVATEIDIRAWNIELNDGKTSNDIKIALPEISPGMDTISEVVNINNLGDTDAIVNYSIVSARILDSSEDNYVASETLSTEAIQDKLSNEYPFHINISLTKGYVLAKGEKAQLQVSVSWPFDSGDDIKDSEWGSKAYNFLKKNPSQTPIEIVLKLNAEQMMKGGKGSDPNYDAGKVILYDVQQDKECYALSETCIKTFVLDSNNQQKDDKVRLLPYFTNNLGTSTFVNYNNTFDTITADWNVEKTYLKADDILSLISTDVNNSLFVRASLSDRIIGYMGYKEIIPEYSKTRLERELENAKLKNGFYQYKINHINQDDKDRIFSYLSSSDSCIWTNSDYNDTKAFGIKNDVNNNGRLYGIDKTESCKVIPVIIGNKKKEQI